MMKSDFMRVDEVVTELDVSRPFAYRVIRQLNDELKKLGYHSKQAHEIIY